MANDNQPEQHRTRITFQVPHHDPSHIPLNYNSIAHNCHDYTKQTWERDEFHWSKALTDWQGAMNTPQFSVPVSHHPSAKRAQTWCQQPTTTSEVASCCKQEQLTSIMDSVHESFVANAKIDDIKVITRCYQERRSHLPKYLTLLSRSSCHHTLVVLLLLLYLFPVIFLSPKENSQHWTKIMSFQWCPSSPICFSSIRDALSYSRLKSTDYDCPSPIGWPNGVGEKDKTVNGQE